MKSHQNMNFNSSWSSIKQQFQTTIQKLELMSLTYNPKKLAIIPIKIQLLYNISNLKKRRKWPYKFMCKIGNRIRPIRII